MKPLTLVTLCKGLVMVVVFGTAVLLPGSGKAYAHERGPWANPGIGHFGGGPVLQHWSFASGAHSYGSRHGGWYGGTHRTYVNPPHGGLRYAVPGLYGRSPYPPAHRVRPQHRRFFRPYSYPWWHAQRYYHAR